MFMRVFSLIISTILPEIKGRYTFVVVVVIIIVLFVVYRISAHSH